MFYIVSYKTNHIIRDDQNHPVVVYTNASEVISNMVQLHGAIWLEPVYKQKAAALRRHGEDDLTQDDLKYFESLLTHNQR